MEEKEWILDVLNGNAVRRLSNPDYWDGTITKEPGQEGWKDYQISVVTTSMDRLGDIQQTLQKNIEDNFGRQGLTEWVLLDYNSKDGLAQWVEKSLKQYIDAGILVFYRTEEPREYSMAHSRNVAFRLAAGEIVNSVDGDNLVSEGFINKINLIANQRPQKAVFAKGKRMLRGRLGFYKEEFINLLGGYDEELVGYGHEDHDLLYRSFCLGFKMMWFGGSHYGTVNPSKHHVDNFDSKDWMFTERRNKFISYFNIYCKRFKANHRRAWGKAIVEKNFSGETICLT